MQTFNQLFFKKKQIFSYFFKEISDKNVATTQIYAEVVNQKKRDAANSISLK